MKKILLLPLVLMSCLLQAQTMDYQQFMQRVARDNAQLLAEQYNVEIAAANLLAARVFNDPELSLAYTDNQDMVMQMGATLSAGMSYGFSLGGVRKARIGVAATEQELSVAVLADFFRKLREQAMVAWGEAWEARERERLEHLAYETMERVSVADVGRLERGEIRPTDARESALEALAQKGDWLEAHADYLNALAELSLLAGGYPISEMDGEDLPVLEIPYTAAEAIDVAERSRADLKAAELSHTLSQKNLALVKATRAMEMEVELDYDHFKEVRNEIAPAPSFSAITLGVTIPLKFSSMNRGELAAAQASVKQAEHYLQAAREVVRTEVMQAWNVWEAACEVASHYSDEVITNARSIMESLEAAYLRGEASLLELRTAVLTYNDVALDAADSQSDKLTATAHLWASLGID